MSWTKKRVVLKLSKWDKKSRSKAMEIAAAQGVTLVGVQGEDKNMLVVIGEGLDVATLTKLLRDKVGHVTIVSVQELKERRCEQELQECGFLNHNSSYTTPWLAGSYGCNQNFSVDYVNNCSTTPLPVSGFYGYGHYQQHCPMDHEYQVVYEEDPPSCSIM